MRILGDPPPGNQASGSDYAARHCGSDSRPVLGDKGSLRRGRLRRALVSCAPFCRVINRDGRLRREPGAEQFLRLTKTRTRCQ